MGCDESLLVLGVQVMSVKPFEKKYLTLLFFDKCGKDTAGESTTMS